ncbi:MAG: restriction endonuclease subunit S [Coprococcus sp.]|nr:restriction endonuclease subunit S [Coprococcus sp.]
MINIKRMKASILSFAFRGELLNFDDKSGVNARLEGIHKKIKNFKPILEQEKLVNAPAHWNWSRLGYITSNHGQITPTETFSYIDVGTLDNANQRLPHQENVVEAKNAPSRAKKIVEFGDVLYSTVRPYLHNICIIDKEFSKKPIASTAFCVMKVDETVLLNKYLFYWLLSPEFDKYSNGNPSRGTLYPAIGEKDLLNGVIPLPTLEEQQSIVDIIDETYTAINQLAYYQSQFTSDFNVLKKKALELAFRGKLTDQLVSDGTAEELLDQIKKEWHFSGKALKGKKTKVKDEIVPFAIPSNWKWCRLSDISNTNIGLTYHPENIVEDGTIVIRSSNIVNGKMDYCDLVKVDCPIKDNQYLKNNDIVICARNGSKALVGKCAIYEGTSRKVSFGAFMAVLRTPFYKYIYYYLHTDTFRRYFSNDDTKQINQVTQVILKNALVPLPPLAEQKRITEKLNEIIQGVAL